MVEDISHSAGCLALRLRRVAAVLVSPLCRSGRFLTLSGAYESVCEPLPFRAANVDHSGRTPIAAIMRPVLPNSARCEKKRVVSHAVHPPTMLMCSARNPASSS